MIPLVAAAVSLFVPLLAEAGERADDETPAPGADTPRAADDPGAPGEPDRDPESPSDPGSQVPAEPTAPEGDGPPSAGEPPNVTPAPVPAPPAASPSSTRVVAAPLAPAAAATAPRPGAPRLAAEASTQGMSPERQQAPAEPPKDEGDGGPFGPLRIGPLVGTGLPGLLAVGGMVKVTRYFGAGLNFSVIPTVHVSLYGDAQLAYDEFDVFGRIFPFGGALYVGAGIGYASVRGSLASTVAVPPGSTSLPAGVLPSSINAQSEASVKTLVLTPEVGALKTFRSGFTIGFGVGVQIPVAPSDVHTSTTVAGLDQVSAQYKAIADQLYQQYVAPTDKKVRDTAEAVGRTPVPTFTFRVGWLL